MDTLWQRGQRAMQHLQKQQTIQTERLQSQLAVCAESYRNLEREHAMLRSGLEALMKHLTLVFGAPPHMQLPPPTVPVPPVGPCAAPSPAAQSVKPSPRTAAGVPNLPTTSQVPSSGSDGSCDL